MQIESGDKKTNGGEHGWITNRQAMKILDLSRPTLQRYRSSGVIPHTRIGSNVYYRWSDIEAVLERNLRNNTAQEVAG